MESICQTPCRNLIIGNRYGGLPKRFTSKNPRIVSIRGFFRQIKENFRYSPFVIGLKFYFLLSIFFVKVNFYLDEGFGFA